MAELIVQKVVEAGVEPIYDAADPTGDFFEWKPGAFVHVKNGDTSPHTLTFASQWQNNQLLPGQSAEDLAVTVPAGEERMVGPFYRTAYRDADGFVQVSYDAVTSVTLATLFVN